MKRTYANQILEVLEEITDVGCDWRTASDDEAYAALVQLGYTWNDSLVAWLGV